MYLLLKDMSRTGSVMLIFMVANVAYYASSRKWWWSPSSFFQMDLHTGIGKISFCILIVITCVDVRTVPELYFVCKL